MRPGGRRVYSDSLDSFGRALGVVGFIRIRGYVRTRPVGCQFHLGSLSSFERALVVVWFIRGRTAGRRVNSGSLCWFRYSLGVVGYIRVGWGLSGVPRESLGSFGFVGFICASPGGHRVHSGSLGSLRRGLGIVGFIRVCWVRSQTP